MEAGGASKLSSHEATSCLWSRHCWQQSRGRGGLNVACKTHAGDERISVGLICVKPHPPTTGFSIAKLAILELAQACLYELQNRNSLQAALL